MVGYKEKKEKVILKAGDNAGSKIRPGRRRYPHGRGGNYRTKTFKRQTESAVIVNVLDGKTIDKVRRKPFLNP